MATRVKKTKRADLTKYRLKRDYPTSKGVKKAGTYVELTLKGKEVLTKQKYI